jgi:hypothetical protein
MHEHAKKIWQAALDGETVQYLTGGFDHEWVDMDPFECNYFSQPQQVPNRWRIKPLTASRWFRVYYDKFGKLPICFNGRKECATNCEQKSSFGGWLTDWVPYTEEVEKEL